MEFREFTGDNVDAAINSAILELQIPSDELEIEVICKETAGFLGFGKKPARIRARRKEAAPAKVAPAVKETAEKKQDKPEKKESFKKEAKEAKKAEKKEAKAEEKAEKKEAREAKETKEFSEEKPEGKRSRNRRRNDRKKKGAKVQEMKREASEAPRRHEPKPEPVIVERTEEEIARMNAAAEEFLKNVFASMELPVEITSSYNKETGNLEVNFEGDDMGILIGKRGQTLDSLQYLTSLVVNKGEANYIRVKLDTENYRSRRKDTLENLAKNIAFKVKRTRKSVSLEPMNPYERRIIHSALQGSSYVETFSEGNEPYRHVVVAPKKNSRKFDD